MGKKHKGQLTISYPQGMNSDYVEIRIVDEASGRQFVECQVEYAEFAKCLGARAYQPCTFEIRDTDKIGLNREHKRLRFDGSFSHFDKKSAANLAALCKEHEVDGWEADVDGALRTQQHSGGTNVHFFRYVPSET